MAKKLTALAVLALMVGLLLNATLPGLNDQAQAATTLPAPPSSLKSTFMLGLASGSGGSSWMKSSGAKWDARYQYLCAGVNTGNGWANWNSPAGQFASYYMDESANNGYTPVFTYYQLLQSLPHSGSNEGDQNYNNLNNASTMNAYFADFKLLMDRARVFGKTVIVHVEPDLWGFLQKRNTNPANISASVASSGYADAQGYANNVAGYAQALVNIRNKYAPNVLLAYHISTWASSAGDLATSKSSSFNVSGAAQETANFYLNLHANYDLMFYDISDRDAAYYASFGDNSHWWDTNNVSYPNFNRFHQFASAITTATGKRGMLWQVPIGNTLYRSENNTWDHYQDNKLQYYLNSGGTQHVQDLANSGIIGILFGRGDGNNTSNEDAAGDGVTNPAAINGNNLTATVSDDDGGYLRQQGQSYYTHVVTLPSAGSNPVPTATPTAAPTTAPQPTATPTAAPQPTATPAPIPATWQMKGIATGTMTAGSPVTITGSFTAPSGANGSYLIDVEVYNTSNWTKVAQWFTTKTFVPGQTVTFTNAWTGQTGSYKVQMGVFTTNWSSNLAWQSNGPAFQVK